jgi:hypothetical protein
VSVWRKDIGRAFVGEARWDEFVQTKKNGDPTHMWRKMSHTMLAKCAEAQALRKAFPQKLGGLYSDDEMAQAENDRDAAAPARMQRPAPPQITEVQRMQVAQTAQPVPDAEFEPAHKPAPAKPPATPPIDPAEKALADDLVQRAAAAEPADIEALLDQAKHLPERVRGVGVCAVIWRRFVLATDLAELGEARQWGRMAGATEKWLLAREEKRRAEITADIQQAAAVDAGAA